MRKRWKRKSGWKRLWIGDRFLESYSEWDNWRDGMRDSHHNDGDKIKRISEAIRHKEPELHSYRSRITGKMKSYYDNGFKKIFENNSKQEKLLLRRKAMKLRMAE